MPRFRPPAPYVWFAGLGHVVAQMRLSSYPSGQPRLDVAFDGGAGEELTIEVPGFDLRAYDADHAFGRLHLVFRCPGRAGLLAGCDVVRPTPHEFRFSGTGQPALRIVYLETPRAWARICEETSAR